MNTIERINQTALELVPLYNQEPADLPDRPLWEHPELDLVIEALRLLSDVLFPGRHIPEPSDFRGFFVKQLKNTAELLQPEIEKALPFRWMGAADLHERRAPIESGIHTGCGHRTGAHERGHARLHGRGIRARAHEVLAHQSPVESERPPAADGGGIVRPRFGDDDAVVRDVAAQSLAERGVDLERLEVAVVDADEARVRGQRRVELTRGVGLHE